MQNSADQNRRPEEGDIVAAQPNSKRARIKARIGRTGLIIGELTMYDSQNQAYVDDRNGEPHVVDARRIRLATELEKLNSGYEDLDF
ncbi:hypothetical protein LWF01_01835 [Saxibacter everestensis]|uniref:Uncharacterized protein n=1 Tax=Saxibacter everestensis TaxID=2909229 RepID=A0ABY8QUP6_9MICO|nr:hypothetical protein LWF01_01835 [Brevibacteriaceae bacterium ZFBP1038]